MNQRERAVVALRRLAPVSRLLHRVALVLLREDAGGQGRHVDPDDPATPPAATARWTAGHARAVSSPTMLHFRAALRPPGGGTEREGVLDDLGRYYGLPEDEVVRRCLGWEVDSLAEWEAAPRDTPDGVIAFYDTVRSWAFDLCWYNYLQSSGRAYPKSVAVADRIAPAPGTRLLDYGSGIGVTAQLMTALGCEVTLADVAAPLLDFARWRLERRSVTASYLHLPAELPSAHFDVVTALDVMAHIPSEHLRHTVETFHRTLRPGGLLVTGYDVRRHSRENAWHLYDDDLPLRWEVCRAGFRPVALLDGVTWIYRAIPRNGLRARLTLGLGWLRLASPPARMLRRVRRAGARLALAAFYRVAARG